MEINKKKLKINKKQISGFPNSGVTMSILMFVIPSVDIKDGKVVRIFQGDPTKVILSENDPVGVSKRWFELGAKFIHIVDLDAVFGKEPQYRIISNILNLGVKATVGGGIRSFENAEYYIKNGAWAVVVSTMIFENTQDFEKLLHKYPEKVIVALDFDENFKTATRGWKILQKEIFELTELFDKKFKGYLFTSIFRDGTALGISKEHFKKIAEFDFGKDKIKIASGGISSEPDIFVLKSLGFWGAVVGRAFYEGKIKIFEI